MQFEFMLPISSARFTRGWRVMHWLEDCVGAIQIARRADARPSGGPAAQEVNLKHILWRWAVGASNPEPTD